MLFLNIIFNIFSLVNMIFNVYCYNLFKEFCFLMNINIMNIRDKNLNSMNNR